MTRCVVATAMMMLFATTWPHASRAQSEPTAFVNLVDATLPEATDYLAHLAGRDIHIGPGAEGRITISSVKAMTLTQVLDEFDKELARNHLVAIKRDTAWLIVQVAMSAATSGTLTTVDVASTIPAQPVPPTELATTPAVPQAIAEPVTSVPPIGPRLRFEGITYANRIRADQMAAKLRDAGFMVGIADASQPGDPAYAVVIEIDDNSTARADFAHRVDALGLSALIALPRTPH